MLDSDPDRRGRTSVCRRVTHFLDQRINAKFAKSMSARLRLRLRVYRLGENAVTGVNHSIPVRVAPRTRA